MGADFRSGFEDVHRRNSHQPLKSFMSTLSCVKADSDVYLSKEVTKIQKTFPLFLVY